MSIVILGAGDVGTHLAKDLSSQQKNVIVIDRDPKALEALAGSADVATKLGSGTDWKLLEELLEQNPALFVAMSSDDETNLAACAIAKNLGYPKTVARIRHSSFLHNTRIDLARIFYVDHFIGTELILAHDIFKCIMNPGNAAVENFAHGFVQMRSVIIPDNSPFGRKPISELKLPQNLLVGLVRRKPPFGEEMTTEKVIFPRGQDCLMPKDEVMLIGEAKAMPHLSALFGTQTRRVASAVIAGGTPLAYQVAKILHEAGIQVKMIEQDERRCRYLAEHLPFATVLNEDPTDLNFLMEEKIELSDAFVACSESKEKNFLAAALAKQAGCAEVIALVPDDSYASLLRRLGIFFLVSERISVANRIHAILQDDAVISVASLYHNQAKIVEIKVSNDSEIVGIPISDLRKRLPEDFLIALIENRGRITIAKGSNIIAPGDTVIVICAPKHVAELNKIF